MILQSIDHLQEQIQTLQARDKEQRREALIQNLRVAQREQEQQIDVLKQALVEKAGEFQGSLALVNEFLEQRAKMDRDQCRLKTKDELESELDTLECAYRRLAETKTQTQERHPAATPTNSSGSEASKSSSVEEHRQPERVPAASIGSSLEDEIEQLKAELAAQNLTIEDQAEEINDLCTEIDRLKSVEDQLDQRQAQMANLRDGFRALQEENARLLHENEEGNEVIQRLQDKLQSLADPRAEEDSGDRMRQMQLLQALHQHEGELQNEMEALQRKWSLDRANIHQRIRLLEEDKSRLAATTSQLTEENAALLKKSDLLFIENTSLTEQLAELTAAHDAGVARIQELEAQGIQSDDHDDTQLHELQLQLEDKDELLQKLERQLSAAKLLARQAKKEREQVSEQLSRCHRSASDA